MNTKKTLTKSLLSLACCFMLSSALAADTPSGTVRITSKSVAVGVGVTWGNGTLTYQGTSHKFSIGGLSVVDLGISKIHTHGEVSNLKNLADFSGHYVAGAEGIAVGGGVNEYVLTNDHGVVLHLHGTEKGVRLQAGAEGVTINLKD